MLHSTAYTFIPLMGKRKKKSNQVCMCAARTQFDLEINIRNQNPEELKPQIYPTLNKYQI
jgi:hypothetical protein